MRRIFRLKSNTSGSGLSTFEGVFTPSILTILGVIMYLRFGWVVGNVGLIGTLIIVTLSTSITFLTSLSIAAIATNQNVKTGGAYYMISRSLGIESGGAVGIPLYIAQALSVALYTIGFAESIAIVFPQVNQVAVGMIVTLLVGGLALLSARIAVRSQFFILAAIAISLVSLVFGKPLETTNIEMWGAKPANSENFWTVFAVFFPAVTGIMAGVNMSGDLKNASKSIPRGTFLAVGAGYLIYMTLPVILAGRADALTLIEDPLIMRKMAYWGDAILLGIWGATLSSAVGSILGAPRVLQALARDRVLPRPLRWMGRGAGKDDNPRIGTVVTLAVALIAVYAGDLNVIAPVLSMFFLATYGVLNISAAIEQFLASPSFRPSFRVHWIFSLTGAVGCVAVMFLINPPATVVAVIFLAGVFIWLQGRQLRTTWGDVREGVWLTMIRMGLLHVRGNVDPKNWRPHILVLSGAPTKRWHLISFTNEIIQNRGLTTVATVVPETNMSQQRILAMEDRIRDYLLNRRVPCLVRVIAAPDPFAGAKRLVESYGLGALVPNTILLGDTQENSHHERYCDMVSHCYERKRNVLIVRDSESKGFGKMKRIDVWWGGLRNNGALMIIIAHLLQRGIEWNNAVIQLNMVVKSEKAAAEARRNIRELIDKLRIQCSINLVVQNDRSFYEILPKASRAADLVIMGLAEPGENFASYYADFKVHTSGLPTTLFVLAAQDIEFDEILL